MSQKYAPVGVSIDGLLDDAEQMEGEARDILAGSIGQPHGTLIAMQVEAANMRKVAKSIRNDANTLRETAWERLFVRHASKLLAPATFAIVKKATDAALKDGKS